MRVCTQRQIGAHFFLSPFPPHPTSPPGVRTVPLKAAACTVEMIHMHWQIFKSKKQDGDFFKTGTSYVFLSFSIRGKEKKIKKRFLRYFFSFFFCAKASELCPSPVPSRLHCYYLHHHHHYEFVCCFNARGGGKKEEGETLFCFLLLLPPPPLCIEKRGGMIICYPQNEFPKK